MNLSNQPQNSSVLLRSLFDSQRHLLKLMPELEAVFAPTLTCRELVAYSRIRTLDFGICRSSACNFVGRSPMCYPLLVPARRAESRAPTSSPDDPAPELDRTPSS